MIYSANGQDYQNDELEHASDEPDLSVLKSAIDDLQADAAWYFDRNEKAWNFWHSIWENQSPDGRKWPEGGNINTETSQQRNDE